MLVDILARVMYSLLSIIVGTVLVSGDHFYFSSLFVALLFTLLSSGKILKASTRTNPCKKIQEWDTKTNPDGKVVEPP